MIKDVFKIMLNIFWGISVLVAGIFLYTFLYRNFGLMINNDLPHEAVIDQIIVNENKVIYAGKKI